MKPFRGEIKNGKALAISLQRWVPQTTLWGADGDGEAFICQLATGETG